MPNTPPLDRRAQSARPKHRPVPPTTAPRDPAVKLAPEQLAGNVRSPCSLEDAWPYPFARVKRRRRRAIVVRLQLIETPTKDYLVLCLRGHVAVAAGPCAARRASTVTEAESSWVLASGRSGSLEDCAYAAACEALDRLLGRW